MMETITIGFIPLADAASLLVAEDFGFAEREGLQIKLVREVSWANVREKLSAGLFDSAHMLAPMAVASALKIMPGEVFAAPYVLATNGNAITVSSKLFDELQVELAGEQPTPLATAKGLFSISEKRKRDGQQPLTFGSTFPFSCHSYQLRFWMAAGGLDTTKDLRLVVLPPSFMVESLKSGEVDGFCVGAPWNSVAVELGLGHILHPGCEIIKHLTEKVLAARVDWMEAHQEIMIRLMRAISAAAAYASEPKNWDECCQRLSAPDRIDASPAVIKGALSGSVEVSRHGAIYNDNRYLILGSGLGSRPDDAQAAWYYSQMVRWGQVSEGRALAAAARAVMSPHLFDRAFAAQFLEAETIPGPADGLGTFAGPLFHKDDIGGYLAAMAGLDPISGSFNQS